MNPHQSPNGLHHFGPANENRAEPKPLTYWMSGGDLFRNVGGKGEHMTVREADRRRRDHEAEAQRTWCSDRAGAFREASLWRELTDALDALANHNRAVGKADPYQQAARQMLAESLKQGA